jgi:hypothetical protein
MDKRESMPGPVTRPAPRRRSPGMVRRTNCQPLGGQTPWAQQEPGRQARAGRTKPCLASPALERMRALASWPVTVGGAAKRLAVPTAKLPALFRGGPKSRTRSAQISKWRRAGQSPGQSTINTPLLDPER